MTDSAPPDSAPPDSTSPDSTSPDSEPPVQPLNQAVICRAEPLPPPFTLFDSTDSTNTQAMQRLLAQPQGTSEALACAAEYQKAGRGRSGRRWLSPPGRNVMLSVGKRLPTAALRQSGLSLAAGVAACRALAQQQVSDLRLKWPNDLMTGGCKLGGILVESSTAPQQDTACIVIGIGINLYLPPDIRAQIEQEPHAQRPAHLSHRTDLNRNLLIGSLAGHLAQLLARWQTDGLKPWLSEYEKLLLWRGQSVRLSGRNLPAPLHGTLVGVDAAGALMLQSAEGALHRFQAGEVSLRPEQS